MQATGVPVKAMEDRPEVPLWCTGLWSAFITLSKRRAGNSAGPQPITVADIETYADYFGYDTMLSRRVLFTVVTALDDVYLDHHRAQATKGAKAPKGRGKR